MSSGERCYLGILESDSFNIIIILIYAAQLQGKQNLAQIMSLGCYVQKNSEMFMCFLRMAAVLYKTEIWKVEINDVRMFSFSNMLDKFVGIDPNAPTIIGTM